MVKDWLANAYEGMSRRQFLARMSVAGFGLAGFAVAANPVEGEVITTPAQGLIEGEGKIARGDFHISYLPGRLLQLPEGFRSCWSSLRSLVCTPRHQGCYPPICPGRLPGDHL